MFCLAGHRAWYGPYRICCPEECGGCIETSKCRETKKAMACCPVSGILAYGRECRRRKEVSCYWRDRNYDALSQSSVDNQFPRLRRVTEDIQRRSSLIHVAMAADRAAWIGLTGAVGSLFAAAKDVTRLRLFVIIDIDTPNKVKNGLMQALHCASETDKQIRFIKFDARQALGNITLKAPEGPAYGNLKTPANFARFFLAQLLPQGIHRLLYLDADVIVMRDVSDLLDSLSFEKNQFAVAAVPRPHIQPCYFHNASRPGMFFCDTHRAIFSNAGITHPNSQLFAFNAGVAVLDLDFWRLHKLDQTVLKWLRIHEVSPLWRLGSNPPLVLAAFQAFKAIDPRWNCDGLGWKKPYDLDPSCLATDAFIWHWSGGRKPWVRGGLYQRIWWHNGLYDARCLTALHDAPLPPALASPTSTSSVPATATAR